LKVALEGFDFRGGSGGEEAIEAAKVAVEGRRGLEVRVANSAMPLASKMSSWPTFRMKAACALSKLRRRST